MVSRVFIPAASKNQPTKTDQGSEIATARRQVASVGTQFSIEVIVDADPEIIILDTIMGTAMVDPAELAAHPAWRETSAVKQGRIGTVNGDLVNRTGPRIVRGLEELAKIIHPELFK